MRLRKIPVTGHTANPATLARAEAAFAQALHREAATPNRRPVLGSLPRRTGQDAGHAFAKITGGAYDHTHSCLNAYRRAVHEAAQRADKAREIAQDSDYLRGLGFHGRNDDDDL